MAVGIGPGVDAEAGPPWPLLLRDALPGLADAIGTDRFGRRLIEVLGLVLSFDWWMVMVYHPRANPDMLDENFTGSWRERGLTTYVGAFFVLDPYYIMSRSLDHPEVCRLVDIAPDGFLESEYHRAHYAAGRIGDEIGYLWPLEPGFTFAVSLERSENRPLFSDRDVRNLEAVQPLLAALARRHWAAARTGAVGAMPLELGRLVQQVAADFGREILTPRECEVVKLVLRGNSTKSISQALGISPGTVKVHRENIYAKLHVSSQAELFNLFIASVSSAGSSPNPG
jgi:DNA-binding CsgD family transcriptional regulator